MERQKFVENPFRPGAGHRPPVLAGREKELDRLRRLLRQGFATENILITGLRGFGKTVLLDQLKEIAIAEGWVWVGNDLSESSSLSEERLALRILTDMAHSISEMLGAGDASASTLSKAMKDDNLDELEPTTFDALKAKYERTPGLPSDKLKAVISRIGSLLVKAKMRGMVFAYDEAQCLTDHAKRDEFPMSTLIETVGSLQKNNGATPCLLVLSGLPPVFEALTAARTYTERMFHVMTLERLSRHDTATALLEPLKPLMPPLNCPPELFSKVVDLSGGYPYLIQFFGKELVDAILKNGGVLSSSQFPAQDVMDRLDAGLFAARWNKTTDKQRRFLRLLASREPGSSSEFSAVEIAAHPDCDGEFDNLQASQMLLALCDKGLVYRTRRGRYSFTVPMSETMILHRIQAEQEVASSWVPTVLPPPLTNGAQPPAPDEEAKPRGFRSWFR